MDGLIPVCLMIALTLVIVVWGVSNETRDDDSDSDHDWIVYG